MYSVVNGVEQNGRVATFGPRDPGSNPGEDQYIMKFKAIIQVNQIIQAYNRFRKHQ